MPLGDVAQSRFRGADDAPDGVLGGKRPRRPDLPDAHFVSLCSNLEKRIRVDSQASANVDRNGYLPLLRDAVDLHIRKYYPAYDKSANRAAPDVTRWLQAPRSARRRARRDDRTVLERLAR